MSNSSPSAGSTPSSSAAQAAATPQAVQFCNQMVTDTTLQKGYLTAINEALANPTQAEQIFENFFNQHGFNGLTIDEVTAAEQETLAYNLSYWQGTYDTTNTATSQSGPQLVISLDANGNVQVSYGGTFIIGWEFQDLVLDWSSSSGLNTSDGQLIFSSASDGNGNLVNGFAGTIGGTSVAGALQAVAGSSGGGMGGYTNFIMMITQLGAQLGQVISHQLNAPRPGAQQLAQRAGQALNEPGPQPRPQGGNPGDAELPQGLNGERPINPGAIGNDNPGAITGVRAQNPPAEEGRGGGGGGDDDVDGEFGDLEPLFSDIPLV